MARDRETLTTQQIAAALTETQGLVTLAARRLSCTSQTLYNYFKRYPELLEIRDEARREMVDSAELALKAAILEKQGWAVCFALKTLGRDRGYQERMTIDVNRLDSDIELELKRLAQLASRGESTITGETESEAIN